MITMVKRLFISLLLALVSVTTMWGQTLVKGDMNGDGQVTVTDVTSVVNVAVGKSPKETINVGGSPYMVDNSLVVGTWYGTNYEELELNADSTVNSSAYRDAVTYKFRPYQGSLMLYNSQGRAVATIILQEVEDNYLLTYDTGTGEYTYWANSGSMATDLQVNHTELAMNSGSTAQLTLTITPQDAFAMIVWSTSDENVATVDENGLVTAVAGGECWIWADDQFSGAWAECHVVVTQMVTGITLSSTMLTLEKDEQVYLTATVLPDNAANDNVVWSSSDTNVAMVTNAGKVITNDYGSAVITCTAADGSGVSAQCLVNVRVVHSATTDNYVDLGLPSGTLWATCNVGATNPEDYGDYFAFGETVPYGQDDYSNEINYNATNSYTRTKYIAPTYKWGGGWDIGATKYCDNSNLGYVDNKTELDPEDDAAYVNWGPDWRTPTKAQFQELINSSYTTSEWTTINNVYGRKITSKSDSSKFIFLPAAGARMNEQFANVGQAGYYYSASIVQTRPHWACYASLNSSQLTVNASGGGTNSLRCWGYSIRPVKAP